MGSSSFLFSTNISRTRTLKAIGWAGHVEYMVDIKIHTIFLSQNQMKKTT
jgi:hypothetical protein